MFVKGASLLSLGRKVLVGAAASGLLVLVLGLGIGLGAASTRAGDGTHQGCVNRTTGVLRIIASGQNCSRYETQIEIGDGTSAGFTGYTTVTESEGFDTDDERDVIHVSAECPEGYRVIGGGAGFSGGIGSQDWALTNSEPVFADESSTTDVDVWIGRFVNTEGVDIDGSYVFSATAICAITG